MAPHDCTVKLDKNGIYKCIQCDKEYKLIDNAGTFAVLSKEQITNDIVDSIRRMRLEEQRGNAFRHRTVITGGKDNGDLIHEFDPRNVAVSDQMANYHNLASGNGTNARVIDFTNNMMAFMAPMQDFVIEILDDGTNSKDKAVSNRAKLNRIKSLNSRTRKDVRWR